jgi:hypothetical protein
MSQQRGYGQSFRNFPALPIDGDVHYDFVAPDFAFGRRA